MEWISEISATAFRGHQAIEGKAGRFSGVVLVMAASAGLANAPPFADDCNPAEEGRLQLHPVKGVDSGRGQDRITRL